MSLSLRNKTIMAVVISIIINILCSIVFFFVGLSIMFSLFSNSYESYYFLIAGTATAALYILLCVVTWIVFYRFTRFKTFSTVFPKVGIPFALLVGFLVYSYDWGM